MPSLQTVEQMIVLGVRSNPEPVQCASILIGQDTIVQANARRVESRSPSPHRAIVQARMQRILLKEPEGSTCLLLDIGWKRSQPFTECG